jgi:hypothetical protein
MFAVSEIKSARVVAAAEAAIGAEIRGTQRVENDVFVHAKRGYEVVPEGGYAVAG